MRKLDDKTRVGFTIIELSLSIAFIAVLSIIVVVIISNAVSSYHRGLTLNQLNTTGMDLVGDMRTAVQSSPARSPKQECSAAYTDSNTKNRCDNDSGQSFVFRQYKGPVKVNNTGASTSLPVFGVFCTGEYSYLWNSGYYFNDKINRTDLKNGLLLKVMKAGESEPTTYSGFRMLKVQDDTRMVCKIMAGVSLGNASGGSTYVRSTENAASLPTNNTIDITSQPVDEDPIDLLEGNSLAIYGLSVGVPAEGGAGNMLYAVSFILGTVQGGINIDNNGSNFCATPEDYERDEDENFDYCAINKFNFAAQATGG